MKNLATAIIFEIMYSRYAMRSGWAVTRAWAMGFPSFHVEAEDYRTGRRRWTAPL